MELIDGKKIAAEIKQEIAAKVAELKSKGGKIPHLAAILVGHDGGSETYVAYKIKDCKEVGFNSSLFRYEDDVSEAELLAKIDELNKETEIDGFIVQLPLPAHISEQKIIEAINPKKMWTDFTLRMSGAWSSGCRALFLQLLLGLWSYSNAAILKPAEKTA